MNLNYVFLWRKHYRLVKELVKPQPGTWLPWVLPVLKSCVEGLRSVAW
ncbi:hypothetical protein LZZ85_03705 [Terrimonas sp. NA20]|uniref:Uncharacterized protein n=1 Tax=Terrimonas ginsenosidimutans TaxID=2908004 RepID=A0ABS9KM22_9BACT|nr:hypothetical protein [Terrimonas ginsenosidimutans]MCG2613366.1 hypothetical protein [Terrimonas ginsenosidimutans]